MREGECRILGDPCLVLEHWIGTAGSIAFRTRAPAPLDTRTARSCTETQMPLEVARHAVGDRTIRVRLTDRRNAARPVEDDFLFQHGVECALY